MTPFLRLYWLVECRHQRGHRRLYQYESYALLAQAEAAAQAYRDQGWDLAVITPVWVEQGEGKRMLASGVLQ